MSQEQDPYFDLDPQRRVRLGMLTPSSNTVFEPICAQMLAQAPWITAHFKRFRVTATEQGPRRTRNSQLSRCSGPRNCLRTPR